MKSVLLTRMTVPKLIKPLFLFINASLVRYSVLDRYLLNQLILPFLLSVGIFSSLGVAIGYLSDLANKVVDYNLPIEQALEILILKIPEFVAYSLPISLLLATLMTYGRLSADSELVALRSCGISLKRIVAPAIALSIIVTGVTFAVNELVVPSANYRVTSILVKYLKEEHSFWQNKDIFYPNYQEVTLPDGEKTRILNSLFYAEKFDGQKMKSLTILQWIGQQLTQIVVSDSAIWDETKNTWEFFEGTVYKIDADASYKKALSFEHRQIPLPKEPFEFALRGRNPTEMNIVQAQEYIKLLKLSGDEKKLLIFQVRTHQKFAFPFLCVVFGLVGAVLGSRPHQMGRGTSFGLTLVITFGYYVLNFVIGSLGMIEVVTPFMAAWLPNFAGLGAGIWLLIKSDRSC